MAKQIEKEDDELEDYEDDEDIEDDEQDLRKGKYKPLPKEPQREIPQSSPKEEKPQVNEADLIAVIQNHEARIANLEAVLFRMKNSI